MNSLYAKRFGTGICLALLFFLAAGCPSSLSPNVSLTSGLVYGLGYVKDEATDSGYSLRELPFDLLQPTDGPASGRPAVLMIHGGSFVKGTRTDEDLVTVADGLATKGYVCFLIDYRVDPDEPPPVSSWNLDAEETKDIEIPSLGAVRAAFVDAKTAMRHIRANSEIYGIDPDRIAVWGESAGAFAALATGLPNPDEFSDDGQDFPVPAENNPGVDPKPAVIIDCWGSAAFTSDAFDSSDPPIMIFHGTYDTTVPVFDALRIKDRCDSFGIPYRSYLIPGAGHGCWEEEYEDKDLTTLTLDFLAEFMP